MKFVDLFAGLGGFHLAAANSGAECVFACEIDEELRDLYQLNFGIRPAGDIRELRPQDIPAHDLLCAGFPCQPFSKAGGQLGFEDTVRGTLFYNIIEILKVARPKFVILENISHFIKHDDGNTYRKAQERLARLGYEVKVKKLSPHQFGVPQIRERMYLVACLGGFDNFEFPMPETTAEELSIRDVLDVNPPKARRLSNEVVECLETWQEFLNRFPKNEELPGTPIWSMEFGATYPYTVDSLHQLDIQELRNYKGSFGCSLKRPSLEEILECVPSHARKDVGVFPQWKQRFIRQNREFYLRHKKWLKEWIPKVRNFHSSHQKLEWHCQGEQRNIWDYVIRFRASGVRVKRPNTSPSLVAMTPVQTPIIGWEKRYMTVRECARLQSMDALERLPSGSRATKALGNAVNVRVVELILRNLLSVKHKMSVAA